MKNILIAAICLISSATIVAQSENAQLKEPWRPQFHFSPKAHWMNDPNGMLYYNGVYHLFFQYYPNAMVWGPMHWGHATSTDLINWKEQSIALYPDSLGYIFSGSAVADEHNSSGLGKDGKAPLVAIFTHHDPKGETAGSNHFQNESIAYSNDEAKTWIKYSANPVLRNPGIRDFRDPKVSWYEPGKKWIMTLATADRISFYSSPDLKNWAKESEFGQRLGAHGGVWECPDLFPLDFENSRVWVLLVSINPGGPNGGSATQYFTGSFDGKTFTPTDTSTRFIDYGTDNYAGVTFSNTGKRRIFLGWMSNWQYGQQVPTDPWRSAMTLPRELGIKKLNGRTWLTAKPVKELAASMKESKTMTDINMNGIYDVSAQLNRPSSLFSLVLTNVTDNNFSIVLANNAGEEIVVGYNKKTNQYYIDRTRSGKIDFEKGFATIHTAPRIARGAVNLRLVADRASVELFADDGLSVMTDIFFPGQPMTRLYIKSVEGIAIKNITYSRME